MLPDRKESIMKRVIKMIVLVMMVSVLFGTSASAAGHISKNAVHSLGIMSSLFSAKKVSKGKSSKKSKKQKKRKASGSTVNGKGTKRPKKSVKSVKNIAAGSSANSGSKSEKSEEEGTILELLPNAMFRVKLKNGSTITAHISGKLRQNFIRIRFGDRVLVEVSPSQPDKGRIIWRYKK